MINRINVVMKSLEKHNLTDEIDILSSVKEDLELSIKDLKSLRTDVSMMEQFFEHYLGIVKENN